jgi:hypothetical protein
MNDKVRIQINDCPHEADAGMTVAAALASCDNNNDGGCTRLSVTGMARAPVCGMGICQECRVSIDGQPHQLACQTLCRPGMQVSTLEYALRESPIDMLESACSTIS